MNYLSGKLQSIQLTLIGNVLKICFKFIKFHKSSSKKFDFCTTSSTMLDL
jgi:hypothetical protein